MADGYVSNATTLTSFFDDQDDAQDAVARLRSLGIADASVRMVGGDSDVSRVDHDKGFWESLGDFFFPDDDRATYAEGLRRGGYLVTVSGLSEDQYDDAVDILDDEGSVNVDERAETWRSEGWTGAGTAYRESGSADRELSGSLNKQTDDGLDATLSRGFGAANAQTNDDVIPVIKEELRVGKRDVNLGRVRVRSYVVEKPVSEQVNLRDDRVHIERKAVDRPVEAGDAIFADRVIEAEEHTEEAVISKEARVTEEIGLRRETEERSKTISDTVRHTEVEIEDERSGNPKRDDVDRR